MPSACGSPARARSFRDDGEAHDPAAKELRDLFRANFASKGFAELGIEPVM